ncbi:MAG: alkaline phosphatase, partial [Dehalococcoidia bacterium]|nr:alkaline phosphatase [Dehalococcoidia bacterium]
MRTALICFLLASAVAVAPGSAVTSSASVPTGKADKVKNVIVMIADGWGYSHVNAASYYESGEAGVQVYEDFPTAMAMSTYMFGGKYEPVQAWSDFNYVKSGVTDSAAAATAMSTGTKTYNGAIGVGINKNRLKNVIERAEERGKATGVVTTVPFSHATPAGFVVHNVNRSNYQAIAREMVLESAVDVIMGSGNPWYNNDGQLRATPNTYQYVGGKTTWDALVEGTVGNDANGDAVNDPWHLIQTR